MSWSSLKVAIRSIGEPICVEVRLILCELGRWIVIVDLSGWIYGVVLRYVGSIPMICFPSFIRIPMFFRFATQIL
jgi:hypothetical protein